MPSKVSGKKDFFKERCVKFDIFNHLNLDVSSVNININTEEVQLHQTHASQTVWKLELLTKASPGECGWASATG